MLINNESSHMLWHCDAQRTLIQDFIAAATGSLLAIACWKLTSQLAYIYIYVYIYIYIYVCIYMYVYIYIYIK